MLGMKMNGKNQIIFNGLRMLHRNIQLLKKANKNTLTEKMHGLKMNGKNQTMISGLKMPHKNM
jgi:hypothetical protein